MPACLTKYPSYLQSLLKSRPYILPLGGIKDTAKFDQSHKYIILLAHYTRMQTTTTLAIFAIVAAMGLIGVVTFTVLTVPQEAEAGCERGPAVSIAVNASKGRCFNP